MAQDGLCGVQLILPAGNSQIQSAVCELRPWLIWKLHTAGMAQMWHLVCGFTCCYSGGLNASGAHV